jgi:hypothetical protein
MNISDCPQKELSKLTAILLDVLSNGARDHRRAHYHLDVECAECMEKPLETRDGSLISGDPKAKKPFDGADPRIQKAGRDLLDAAANAGRPLYLIQLDFAREGSKWKAEPKLQSVAEYRVVSTERATLDTTTTTMLVAAVEKSMPDWRHIFWNLNLRPKPEESLKLVAAVKELQFRQVEMSKDIRAGIEEYRAFYKERGFNLQRLDFDILGGSKKRRSEVDVYYG